MKMLYITDECTDPYWNLAAEEYLLDNFREPIFRLWRNERAVIVGRYQNSLSEIDSNFVERRGVAVVRRLTGGGAVFHDLGNVNYTFIENKAVDEDSAAMFRRFTQPVISALKSLGVDARLEGRNDLTIGNRKFSGNAMCLHNGRILQHGTLLFSSSVEDLSGALKTRAEKFEGKAVRSVRSRVTNISEHLPRPMTVAEFIMYLGDYIGKGLEPYTFSEMDRNGVEALARNKYRTYGWNFGKSPSYTFRKTIRFSPGLVELQADIENGIIRDIDIRGDYFFSAPTEDFCACIKGCQHSRDKVRDRLLSVPVPKYFNSITAEELLELFF